MGYMDILRAQKKSGQPPAVKPHQWSKAEKERMAEGLCVKCGENPAGDNSYLCQDCESKETLDEIQKEVAAARRKATNG